MKTMFNRSLLNTLLVASTISTSSIGFAQSQNKAEEALFAKVISKVLAAVDYSKVEFDLKNVEASFGAEEGKSTEILIDSLNASATLPFKQNITFTTEDFIKGLPDYPQAKQWIPDFVIDINKIAVVGQATTLPTQNKGEASIRLNIDFKDKTALSKTIPLRVAVANELNKNLIVFFVKGTSVNVTKKQGSPEITVNGTCGIEKEIAKRRIQFQECSFKGKVNTDSGAYQIKVKLNEEIVARKL